MSDALSPSFLSTQVKRGIYLLGADAQSTEGELEVVCAGWEQCSPEYRIDRTSFPYFALELVSGGEWELVLNGEKRVLRPGSIFSYGPGVAYSLRPLGGGDLGKYFVDFEGKGALGRLREAGLELGRSRVCLPHRWLQELFDQLIETREFAPGARRRVGNLTLELMLSRMPEQLREGVKRTQAWLSFERCRGYLAERYLEIGSLSEAAQACGVSPAYLSRLFKRFSNESPKVFLDRMKMSHAAQKLLRGNLQVKEASLEVGYEDVFHFSRVFKKRFGVSPSQYAQRRE